MDRCDALIVGGGPAGSSCAWKLERAGFDVLILDRAAFPRDKPCAGWITPQVLTALGIAPEDYGRERVIQPVHAFRTGLIGGPAVETRYASAVSYGIRRCEFDHYLLCRSGARVRPATPATRFRRERGEWIVNDEIRTPLLIGAGGHFCPVARQLGDAGVRGSAIVAQEIEFLLTGEEASRCRVSPQAPELYFCPDGRGYGWSVRKGDYLNVGFGRHAAEALPPQVQAFVEWLRAQGRLPAELPAPWKGHAYALYADSNRPLLAEGVLLVGDAAGLAYTASGEGIRPAVESGLLAARAVIEARGRYRREDLEPYRTWIEARFGKRGSGAGLARFVPAGLLRAVGAGLLRSPWWTRHVLLDRWFLHAGQPALAFDR